ncbi:MAG: DUF4386 domain-containing protein [Anaerolineae bacterium]|nr:DUF4386 domain-containing protein [Anaerolineae bacterium]
MIFFRIAGVLLIVLPLMFTAAFFSLKRTFDYPAILRRPTENILKRFTEGGPRLIFWWYAFTVSAVLIIPTALFFQLAFVEQHQYLATSAGIVGALSGIVQAIGHVYWVFLAPSLAKQYNAEATTPTSRETVTVVFRAFHQYAGVAIGQHLGYLLTGVWTLLISSMMFSTPIFGAPLAILGIVAALGILAGLFEPAGWKPASAISATGYLVWSVWLFIAGVMLLRA